MFDQYNDFDNGIFAQFDFFIKLFWIFFAIVATIILITIGKELIEWIKNNRSPIETVKATVIAKRQDFHAYNRHYGRTGSRSSYTKYYVTFELSDKTRKEFRVKGHQYGLLIEQDKGQLVYQGTRFKSFNP